MKNLSQHLGDPRRTPQSKPIPGREHEMHRGPASGYVFKTGDWERLDRFLIIGTDGGTYYASERSLTVENATVVRRCLKDDRGRAIARIVEISDRGLAPKNDPAILALVIAFVELKGQHVAELRMALQRVCRTGTHLFQFLEAVTGMRGGGRGLNGAVRAWMNAKPVDKLALQMVKYRNRAGWTWRDVLRRYRPRPGIKDEDATTNMPRAALYAWAAGKAADAVELPSIVRNTLVASEAQEVGDLARHVLESRLPWECVPSEHTTDPQVLEALFEHMPMMATVRQLSRLQAHGVLPKRRDDVVARLNDPEAIQKSRIHPVALMLAAHAYEVGRGRHLTWTPDPKIVDALDDAFQLALKCAEPTGKRMLIAIDSSGSMHGATAYNGIPLFKIAAAMALTYVRTDGAHCMAFDYDAGQAYGGRYRRPNNGMHSLALSGRMRVTDAMRAIRALGMGGGTDCALPFRYALERELDVDCFVVFTDSETWAGRNQHPAQAFQAYKEKRNPKARVVWCAMTAGSSSLGLPDDGSALGISGFDASAPKLVGDFAAGRF